jgi:hypothetical protein
METERRRQILLGALAVVLAVVVYQAWPRTSAAPSPASNQRRAAAPAAAAGTSGKNASAREANPPAGPTAPDVHLEALEAKHPKPGAADRNLFRFKPKAPPPPPPSATRPVDAVPVAPAIPSGPPPPPPAPPITVKLIGVLDRADKTKVAVLSDGLGQPQIGKEGEVVFGRYRILKIGVESIDMAYLDGRGRQTIRLSGT